MYLRGLQVAPDGGEVLAQTVVPYFNRTWEHYCSHRHTPSSGQLGYPAIVRRGRVIYMAHPVFTQYQQNAPRWVKTLVLNSLDMLLPDPLVRHAGPSTVTTALNEQPAQGRAVLHLFTLHSGATQPGYRCRRGRHPAVRPGGNGPYPSRSAHRPCAPGATGHGAAQ